MTAIDGMPDDSRYARCIVAATVADRKQMSPASTNSRFLVSARPRLRWRGFTR